MWCESSQCAHKVSDGTKVTYSKHTEGDTSLSILLIVECFVTRCFGYEKSTKVQNHGKAKIHQSPQNAVISFLYKDFVICALMKTEVVFLKSVSVSYPYTFFFPPWIFAVSNRGILIGLTCYCCCWRLLHAASS